MALVNSYRRFPVTLVRGEGVRVWDAAGREYLDLAAGIAVSSVGHCHPHVAGAIRAQAGEILHTSNLFTNQPGERLAEALARHSGGYDTFLCNSGTEAVETAIKVARLRHRRAGRPGDPEILVFDGAFHGRTLGALSATAEHRDGFEPLLEGFVRLPWNDPTAVEAAVSERTAAILFEPIQGESGIREASVPFMRALRAAADRVGALLIADEIQSGMYRTGDFFAHSAAGIRADVVTMAKGLAGGLPVGAVLMGAAARDVLRPGDHGSTFGGNPVVAAAAVAVLEVVEAQGLALRAKTVGARLRAALERQVRPGGPLRGVRGRGLMLGLELVSDPYPAALAGIEAGVLTVTAGENVLRLLPPLILTEADADEALARLGPAVTRAPAG